MKPQKDSKGFIDQSITDLIDGGDARMSLAALPKSERKKKIKAKAQQDARNGRRAVYDMDRDVIKAIHDVAERERCSASNVAEIALHLFLRSNVDLSQYRIAVQHPKFDCRLEWKE